MTKSIILFIFTGFFFLESFSQTIPENNIKVQDIISPSARTYNTVDSFNIVIRIQNLGPNALIPGDKFDITYTIENGGTNSQFFDTLLLVGGSRSMEVNEGRIYTLASNFKVNDNNTFAVCADVSGTFIYPRNTNKDPGDCQTFIVNLEKVRLSIEKVYFADQAIHLFLNRPESAQLEVYDITGKRLINKKIQDRVSSQIPFDAPSSGFYFVKLSSPSGEQVSAKFVVN